MRRLFQRGSGSEMPTKSSESKTDFFSNKEFDEQFRETEKPVKAHSAWRQHINALRNTPPVFKMVWEAAPGVVASSVLLRILSACIPVALLAVTKVIIDSLYALRSHNTPLPHYF